MTARGLCRVRTKRIFWLAAGLRGDPRAQSLIANARARGHTKREARRILKRHLSNAIYRTMISDLSQPATTP